MGNSNLKQARGDIVTVREFYQLIDQRMADINKTIEDKFNKASDGMARIEKKFDDLESGRLSLIEREVSMIQGKIMMVPVIVTIGVNVFFFIVQYFLKLR